MPIIRLTRRGTIGQCNCKVGGCRICGSACRRCKCACDGVAPLDALKRKVGKVPKKRQTQSKLQNNRKKRQCTKKGVAGVICTANDNENDHDNDIGIMEEKNSMNKLDEKSVCVEVKDSTREPQLRSNRRENSQVKKK